MTTQTFCNAKDDCQWLVDTHLKNRKEHIPHFRSFTFTGSSDCPYSIALYEDVVPFFYSHPVAVYKLINDDETESYYSKV